MEKTLHGAQYGAVATMMLNPWADIVVMAARPSQTSSM